MLLTGSWSDLVSRYAGLDLRSRTGGFSFLFLFFFFAFFQFRSIQQFFDHLLSLEQKRRDHDFYLLVFFRASFSRLNSFVKLALASSQPPTFSPAVLAECVRVGESRREREREREIWREREREREPKKERESLRERETKPSRMSRGGCYGMADWLISPPAAQILHGLLRERVRMAKIKETERVRIPSAPAFFL